VLYDKIFEVLLENFRVARQYNTVRGYYLYPVKNIVNVNERYLPTLEAALAATLQEYNDSLVEELENMNNRKIEITETCEKIEKLIPTPKDDE